MDNLQTIERVRVHDLPFYAITCPQGRVVAIRPGAMKAGALADKIGGKMYNLTYSHTPASVINQAKNMLIGAITHHLFMKGKPMQTECDEIAEALILSKGARIFSMDDAMRIARQAMPDETETLVSNTAESLYLSALALQEKTLQQVRDCTARNAHSEALQVIADAFGFFDLQKASRALIALHHYQGDANGLQAAQARIRDDLLARLPHDVSTLFASAM